MFGTTCPASSSLTSIPHTSLSTGGTSPPRKRSSVSSRSASARSTAVTPHPIQPRGGRASRGPLNSNQNLWRWSRRSVTRRKVSLLLRGRSGSALVLHPAIAFAQAIVPRLEQVDQRTRRSGRAEQVQRDQRDALDSRDALDRRRERIVVRVLARPHALSLCSSRDSRNATGRPSRACAASRRKEQSQAG
jgi:hypothetical protein